MYNYVCLLVVKVIIMIVNVNKYTSLHGLAVNMVRYWTSVQKYFPAEGYGENIATRISSVCILNNYTFLLARGLRWVEVDHRPKERSK